MYLIGRETVVIINEYNIKSHYETKHHYMKSKLKDFKS